MKKVFKLNVLAALLVIILVVSSCSPPPAQTTKAPEETTKAKEEAKETKKAEESKPEEKAEEIVAGFIFIGPINDGGYTEAHDKGRQQIENELGIKTIYKESVPEDQSVETEIRNLIDQGANVIFGNSFGYMDYMENVAKEYPDVKFFHCSGYKTGPNFGNYFGKIYQARYLTGIAAGMKTEANKIGYVAAFPIPEVIRGINAFTLGAKSVNPDVTVEVVWTNTWYDPALEKEAAIALLDKGVDIIAQHQDTAGPQQAAEERGVWSIGYDTDMYHYAPKANITSAVWDWGKYYTLAIQQILDGQYQAEAWWGDMSTGIADVAPISDNAAEGTKEAVEKAKQQILDKELIIFKGPIMNNKGEEAVADGVELNDGELLSMMWFVDGVIGSVE